ncbi:MAG: AMP-binding protein [Myxococcota bacterium]
MHEQIERAVCRARKHAGRLSVFAAAREAPEATALTWRPSLPSTDPKENLESLTYAELACLVHRARDALDGFDTNSNLGFCPRLDVSSVIWMLALFEQERPFVLVHPKLTGIERARRLHRVGASICVDSKDSDFRIDACQESSLPDVSEPLPGFMVDAGSHWREPTKLETPVLYITTSGTTGKPKVVTLSRRALAASVLASEERLGPIQHGTERWLLLLPPAHIGGLSIILRMVAARSTVVLGGERFAAQSVIESIDRHQITRASLVPAMLRQLLDAGLTFSPSLRTLLVGGAACPKDVVDEARKRGLPVRLTYGMTETCSQVATEGPRGLRAWPVEGADIRVSSASHRPSVGPLEVRGAMLFSGYLGEATVHSPYQWFRTGDLGRMYPDGSIEVVGRESDRIITGGENIDPVELEQRLLQLIPELRDVCVFGVQDDTWGERIAMVAVFAELQPAGLRELLYEYFASHERPRLVAAAMPGEGPLSLRSLKRSRAEIRSYFLSRLASI